MNRTSTENREADARVDLLEATHEAVDFTEELGAHLRRLVRELKAETLDPTRRQDIAVDLYDLTAALRAFALRVYA